MDATDDQILSELSGNARLSFSELGRRVGLSTNAAAARVRRLESIGVIAGYTLVYGSDWAGPGAGLEVFIDLRLDPGTDNEAFIAAIKPLRQIIDAVHLTGPFDYLVHAQVGDTAALDALIKRLKQHCGAAQTQTRVALRPSVQR